MTGNADGASETASAPDGASKTPPAKTELAELAGKKTAAKFVEPAKDLDWNDDADVIVCGGGPAGFSAALTAARAGAKVRLFELHGCLGGVWTAGLLTYIFDFDKPGLPSELRSRLDAIGGRRHTNIKNFVYDPEAMKWLLETMCRESKVDFWLQAQVAAAYKQGNRLSTIVTESKSGRQAWNAKVFIDATGDGDLGAQAGCGWDIGQQVTCPCQPMTLNSLAVVRDVDAIKDCISFYQNSSMHTPSTQVFRKEIAKAGFSPSYSDPTLFHIRDNLVMVMINHEYGVLPYDTAQVTAATVRARDEIHRIVRGLNQLGGRWDGMQLVATAEQIGIRDGRRIHGRYQVVKDDLVKGVRHDDAVTRATFGVDIHAHSRAKNDEKAIDHGGFRTKPYDIPLRALIAKDVDGLMMAGRNISGDFIAHASYRVTGNSVGMGEAAGVVAAMAAKSNKMPQEIAWSEAQPVLEEIRRKHA